MLLPVAFSSFLSASRLSAVVWLGRERERERDGARTSKRKGGNDGEPRRMNRDGPLRFARRGRFSISVGALLSQQSSVVSFPLFVLSPSAVCPFCFHHFAGFFFVLFCVLIDEWNEATDFIFITRQTVNRRNIPREIPKKKQLTRCVILVIKTKCTYVFVVVERVEDVVRQAGEEVDDEPALEVIHADDFGVGDHLAAGADERRVKVEDNVDEEDDVDDRVDDQQTDVLGRLVLEGHVVGHHDGRVEGEAEDDPVPQGLEGAVMQQDVRRRFRRLLTVLRQDVRIQAHHLPS